MKLLTALHLLLLGALFVLTYSCAKAKTPLVFKNSIIKQRCAVCHYWARTDEGILTRVVSGEPERSTLYQYIIADKMPPLKPFTDIEKKEVYDFIKGLK